MMLVRSLILVAVAFALIAPAASHARDGRPGFGPRTQAPGGQNVKQAPAPPKRDERGKRMEHDKGHKTRLTDQERLELQRDLDRAEREIYKR